MQKTFSAVYTAFLYPVLFLYELLINGTVSDICLIQKENASEQPEDNAGIAAPADNISQCCSQICPRQYTYQNSGSNTGQSPIRRSPPGERSILHAPYP